MDKKKQRKIYRDARKFYKERRNALVLEYDVFDDTAASRVACIKYPHFNSCVLGQSFHLVSEKCQHFCEDKCCKVVTCPMWGRNSSYVVARNFYDYVCTEQKRGTFARFFHREK
ncbi:MAG: hypothetical protein IJ560_02480 [Alphaproteobacteria bacterium]|nr:hypothetical protein [Alphaproteobacteria bacterium]